MFKYLSNLFKKNSPKEEADPPSQEKEIDSTPPIEATSLEIPKVPIITIKPIPQAILIPIKLEPKRYRLCHQCTQKINMSDSVCRFCLYKG